MDELYNEVRFLEATLDSVHGGPLAEPCDHCGLSENVCALLQDAAKTLNKVAHRLLDEQLERSAWPSGLLVVERWEDDGVYAARIQAVATDEDRDRALARLLGHVKLQVKEARG